MQVIQAIQEWEGLRFQIQTLEKQDNSAITVNTGTNNGT